jgi:hypothetical protein
MSIVQHDAPAESGSARAPHAARPPAPIYVVCSPRRRVGKTLLARLLTEYHTAAGRPVAAFDLADEGPQLADYLPNHTTITDISDVRGQMAFFDHLIADNETPKVIDVSHRTFRNFFTVAHNIRFFEEAHRRSIEPVILFLFDPDPKSAQAYAMLQRWFAAASLVPVRNQLVARGMPYRDVFPNASIITVLAEMPVLHPSLRGMADQESFSFAEFRQTPRAYLPARLHDEFQGWIKGIFLQFREIELCLMCEQILSSLQ